MNQIDPKSNSNVIQFNTCSKCFSWHSCCLLLLTMWLCWDYSVICCATGPLAVFAGPKWSPTFGWWNHQLQRILAPFTNPLVFKRGRKSPINWGFNRKIIYKWGPFHCYVWLPDEHFFALMSCRWYKLKHTSSVGSRIGLKPKANASTHGTAPK